MINRIGFSVVKRKVNINNLRYNTTEESLSYNSRWFLLAAFLITTKHGELKIQQKDFNNNMLEFQDIAVLTSIPSLKANRSPAYKKLQQKFGKPLFVMSEKKPWFFYTLNKDIHYSLLIHKKFISLENDFSPFSMQKGEKINP